MIVFAYDARAARVCAYDGASSLSRHLPIATFYASLVATSVVMSVARVLGALSASAGLRLS